MKLNFKAVNEFNSQNMMDHKNKEIIRATKYNLIDISEPLMIAFEQLNTYYFVYALQNRTIAMKNGEIADVQELLIAQTTLKTIVDLLEEKIDISSSLFSCKDEVYRVGKVGNKVFPAKKIENFEQVDSKLPIKGVNLDKTLPNKTNLKKILKILKSELNYREKFLISDHKIDKKTNVRFSTPHKIDDYGEYVLSGITEKNSVVQMINYEVEV